VPVSSYYENEQIYFRVNDQTGNLNPAALDTITITVTSSVSGDSEQVVLTETGTNTGIFTGSIQSTTSPTGNNNGR
jgi:large repetitive protein